MRVVFFRSTDLESLARQLNEWLQNCPDEYVHDIKYTDNMGGSAMVILKNPGEKNDKG